MPKNSGRIFLALLVLLAIAGPGALGQSSDQPRRVLVAPVVEKSVPLQLEYVGNIKAAQSAAIKARVVGNVMSYSFREGEDVEKDQLLFTIDPRPYEATLDAAQAASGVIDFSDCADRPKSARETSGASLTCRASSCSTFSNNAAPTPRRSAHN